MESGIASHAVFRIAGIGSRCSLVMPPREAQNTPPERVTELFTVTLKITLLNPRKRLISDRLF
jgi:hypothetical protein